VDDVAQVRDNDPIVTRFLEADSLNWCKEEHPDMLKVRITRNLASQITSQDLIVVRVHKLRDDVQLGPHILAFEFELERQKKRGMVHREGVCANIIENADKVMPAVFQLAHIFAELAEEDSHLGQKLTTLVPPTSISASTLREASAAKHVPPSTYPAALDAKPS